MVQDLQLKSGYPNHNKTKPYTDLCHVDHMTKSNHVLYLYTREIATFLFHVLFQNSIPRGLKQLCIH